MRKVIIGVIVALVTLGLIAGVFAAGALTGRLLARRESVRPEQPDTILPVDPDSTPGEVEMESPTPISQEDTGESPNVDTDLLEEVLTILEREFYGDLPDAKTLAYGAIRGMLMTLDDPYTSFIDPNTAAILNEDATGEFEGIGATVRMREDGYLEIVRPLPGHPAEDEGLEAGDLILTVDDESIVGLGLYEAISLIRGPAGTEVELEIARPGERDTFFVTVTRARIELPLVESEILEENIAYLRLTEFDGSASDRIESTLEELLSENPKGLVFDLRDNPGGLLSESIRVSDIFLGEGLIAIERDSLGNEQQFYSYDGDVGEDIPLVVLVNMGSASASEIVAGALQDRERATLIGETTLGKGSVQLPHNLSDGSQLRVTIARWFTPDDHSIHGEGLVPDIEVPVDPDTPVTEDPQLDRAVEFLLEGE